MFLHRLSRLPGLGFLNCTAASRRARYCELRAELEQLTPEQLAELGLERGDIERVARDAAYA